MGKKKTRMEERLDEGMARALRQRADTVRQEALVKAFCPDGTGRQWSDDPASAGDILKDVMKMSDDIKKMKEEPYRRLLRAAGMDEDKDWIFISQHWADLESFTIEQIPTSLRDRVKFTRHLKAPVLLVRCPFTWGEVPQEIEKQHA